MFSVTFPTRNPLLQEYKTQQPIIIYVESFMIFDRNERVFKAIAYDVNYDNNLSFRKSN